MAEIWPETFFFNKISLKDPNKSVPQTFIPKLQSLIPPLGVYVDNKFRISRVKYHTLMPLVEASTCDICPLVNSNIINPTLYFNLFHPKLCIVLPHEVLPHIPKYCPLRLLPKHHPVKPFSDSPQVFLPLPTHLTPPPPHFYRSIPNHLHVYALNARTT